MHESENRGKLLLNGNAMPEDALSRLLGLDNQILTTTLTTLLTFGVASRCSKTQAIMSRRMVRDEEIRQVRKSCGKLGGNPNLLNQTSNQKPTTQVKVNPTPSSSSSSSSSDQEKNKSNIPAMAETGNQPLQESILQLVDGNTPSQGTSKPRQKKEKTNAPAAGSAMSAMMVEFDRARKAYPGSRGGLNPEWNNFFKKNKAMAETIIPKILPAIEAEIQQKAKEAKSGWVASWKNFTTWINKECWDQMPANNGATHNGFSHANKKTPYDPMDL